MRRLQTHSTRPARTLLVLGLAVTACGDSEKGHQSPTGIDAAAGGGPGTSQVDGGEPDRTIPGTSVADGGGDAAPDGTTAPDGGPDSAGAPDAPGDGGLAVTGSNVTAVGGGEEITLVGTGFSSDRFANVVTFDSHRALVVSATPTELRVLVPYRIDGPTEIVVTVAGASSAPLGLDYTVLAIPLQGDSDIPGEMMIGVADAQAALARSTEQAVEQAGGIVFARVPAMGLVAARVPLGGEAAFGAAIAAALAADFVEPVQFGRLGDMGVPRSDPYLGYPDDPGAPQQWSLTKTGLSIPLGPHLVRVCIIDSGVDVGHPDLTGRFVADGRDFIKPAHRIGAAVPGNGLDDDGDGRVDVFVNHGTFVAGIVAAGTDNGAGIAGGARVDLVSLRVGDDEGRVPMDAVAAAVDYAVDPAGAACNVLNLSFAFRRTSETVRRIVASVTGARALAVAATGNDFPCPGKAPGFPGAGAVGYPAALSSDAFVIAVGATAIPAVASDPPTAPPFTAAALQANETLSCFSNRGPEVEVVAPGTRLYSTSFPGGGYTTESGTSFSTPQVTAAAAVIWSWTGNPGPATSKAERVQETLLGRETARAASLPAWLRADSATDHPTGRGTRDDDFGLGRLDMTGRLLFDAWGTNGATSVTSSLGAVRLRPDGFGGFGTIPANPLPEDSLLLAGDVATPGVRRGFQAAFAPDRRAVVYARRDGLWAQDLTTGITAQLSTDRAASAPSWSPDGGRLLFVSRRDGDADIWAMDVDREALLGSNERAIVDTDLDAGGRTINEESPDFSPAGTRIAFAQYTYSAAQGYRIPKVVVQDVDASTLAAVGAASVLLLPAGVIDAARPRFSPDGKSIAFDGNRPESYTPQDTGVTIDTALQDVYIHHLLSGTARRITADSNLTRTPPTSTAAWFRDSVHPVWLPDGRRIAYVDTTYYNQPGTLAGIQVRLIDATARSGVPAAVTVLDAATAGYAIPPNVDFSTVHLAVSRF